MTLCRWCNGPEHNHNCDRYAMKVFIGELREQLRVKSLELEATKKLGGDGVIMISSLISHRNQKPRIDIQVGEIHTQMDADAAMDVAKHIIECAEGAYADAFIFHYLKEKLNQPDHVRAGIINDFREYREGLAQEFEQMQKDRP